MATVFSNIANKGVSYKPYILDKFTKANGQVIPDSKQGPKILADLRSGSGVKILKEHYDLVQEGLFRVVNSEKGTARWYALRDILFAGKTGTSQIINLSPSDLFTKCSDRPHI